jgi:hypothetical protein
VHRTLHCAMSGAPAAARKVPLFLCAVRWFTGHLLCAVRCAPDRHCRLSGAPITRFKKQPPARAEPEALWLFFSPSRPVSVLGDSWRPPSPLLSGGLHLRRRPSPVTCALLLLPLREQPPVLPLSLSLSLFSVSEAVNTTFCKSSNSCESNC